MEQVAGRLDALLRETLGGPLPLRLRAWDGSEVGPEEGPTLVVRSRRALHRLLWKPGELGLARAWVAGEITVEGDLYEALNRLAPLVWQQAEQPPERISRSLVPDPRLLRLARQVLALAGPSLPPAPPREEVAPRRGIKHTLRRDREAIHHHYDVGNDFYAMVLGPSMVYSCGYWPSEDSTLEEAQFAKLDLVCRKLGLKPGQRLLDVGCGWGSMALHAAEHYGVQVVGVTISVEQADLARKRVVDAGLTDRVEIRVQDYRQIEDGPFDAISSIGMAEHVGSTAYSTYARQLFGLLKPGGRLLNHQIARPPRADESTYEIDQFIDRYVFPDGELSPVGTTVSLLEQAGFEVRDLESIREHYALTLRAWVANLEHAWSDAVRQVTPGRARVWRLYMAASALAFEQNGIGVNQVLAVRPRSGGVSGMRLVRGPWPAPEES